MIEIDGSQGEGGGQIIRSSLSLSTVTGQPVTLTNIRAGRKKPGLMRQHLTAIAAVAEISSARVEGAELNSSRITFEPGVVKAGDFRFQVGTAGSTSLVAQTILPALMIAETPSTVVLTGGTHNPWAPPFDFFTRVFLPQLARMGADVDAELVRHGFYPAGGGEVKLTVRPTGAWRGLELREFDPEVTPRVTAIVSALSREIAERECNVIRRRSGWSEDCFEVREEQDPRGPGNAVMIELACKRSSELFIAHGKVGVRGEHLARAVLKQARAHLARRVPVGEYLADQLMLPMGLAATRGNSSRFRTGPLSMHSQTHLQVLHQFLPIASSVTDEEDGSVMVRFEPSQSA
ncbi:MAG: RNA 3'-terminal phosphate cyclase [Planctomycetota bacterium]